ncbi:2-hydroxyacid dehydrogenase [Novispirillum itersonii]|uniref:Glyoxylate/hydroxypyruvate reductase A n=1 Tax=Novispirillum itersonii TaxID=189 RepID=A0A7W9ZH69_NOVIT|nr:glyoxylate/hydroxypyruvate reductase A [Novispirillum itersonii]MBB6210209.1 glyoxylate/hydroxypyruvate reductase A [Novispirillum itersonii]
MSSPSRPLLYVISGGDDPGQWRGVFSARFGDALRVAVWPEAVDPAAVEYIAAWSPPAAASFAGFANLKAVFNLGAGVDKLLARPDLDPAVPIVRLQDAGMAPQMVEYALYGVLRHQRDFDVYAQDQAERRWQPRLPRLAAETRVTVLGIGAIGGAVAVALAGLGYSVRGWSRSLRSLPGVDCRAGADALPLLLPETDILISVLPSTPETRGMFNAVTLGALPAGASFINCARGDQVDEAALLDLLDSGHIRMALLDVFRTEPLPQDSRLWSHPCVVATPHVAASTLPGPAVDQIADGIAALSAGISPLPGQVDRSRAY